MQAQVLNSIRVHFQINGNLTQPLGSYMVQVNFWKILAYESGLQTSRLCADFYRTACTRVDKQVYNWY